MDGPSTTPHLDTLSFANRYRLDTTLAQLSTYPIPIRTQATNSYPQIGLSLFCPFTPSATLLPSDQQWLQQFDMTRFYVKQLEAFVLAMLSPEQLSL